ncbi:uncharacterized protein LOC125225965 [Leguminivora glycinivorella]|uniref:uncharacterized protein LOC125225965 n=1 Tax=Leguminivora glycinivorella TaxID=1035111 RepID=UPI002010B5FE|nr:uncharacterized protein LOC125225965 [Leguminivora glycinivorella]
MVMLYKLDASPPARACMVACELFNIPVQLINVDMPSGEHKKPEYLKKNPLHTVPVLEDDNVIIHDSHAILMYLADVYGKQDSVYPKDPKQRARVNQMLFFDSSVLFQRLRNITYPLYVEGITDIPEKNLLAIDEAYGYIEEFLSRSKYLAGDNITIADVSAFTTVGALVVIRDLDTKKYPKLQAWLKEIESLPYIQKGNTKGAKEFETFVKSKLERDALRKWRPQNVASTESGVFRTRPNQKVTSKENDIVLCLMVKLYKINASPPARSCMVACELFNIPVQLVDVDFASGENRKPEYLKKNPLHTVPVLEDDNVVIHDSHAILMYLADVYGKQESYYPKDPKQRARVNQILFFNSSVLFGTLRNISYPLFVDGITDVPEKNLLAIDEAYGYIEEFLSRSKYLAGDNITIADISAFPMIGGLIAIRQFDAKKYPKLQAWLKEIESLPYVQKGNAKGAQEYEQFLKSKLG